MDLQGAVCVTAHKGSTSAVYPDENVPVIPISAHVVWKRRQSETRPAQEPRLVVKGRYGRTCSNIRFCRVVFKWKQH